MRTAFIGLGVMGYPMAGYLKRGGHDVVVYNRTTAKADQWCDEFGGSSEATATADGESLVRGETTCGSHLSPTEDRRRR